MRVPTKDDPFLMANVGRMFQLLSAVDSYPPGIPLKEELRLLIQSLFTDAYEAGIDIIAVSEGGLAE
jgi:hypothetical protein